MNNLTDDERRMAVRAIHEAFVEAERRGEGEKAEYLRRARDKLEQ